MEEVKFTRQNKILFIFLSEERCPDFFTIVPTTYYLCFMQANISLEEYTSKLNIYRASVAQTAAIQALRQHFQAHLQHTAVLTHHGKSPSPS